jgi:hypothetical protein
VAKRTPSTAPPDAEVVRKAIAKKSVAVLQRLAAATAPPNPPEPEMVRTNVFKMQVCVPKGYTKKQIEAFAAAVNPPGTVSQWRVCKEKGYPLRVKCAKRDGCVHVVLEV